MAVRIRLRRTGKKKQPHYRVVVADSRQPRDGRFIEVVGYYNPRAATPEIRFDEERALHWLRQGAQPSDTVRSLLAKQALWERFTGEKSASQAQSQEEGPAEPAGSEATEPAAEPAES